MELVNTVSDCSIGHLDIQENGDENYQPIIMWNLRIESYISDPDSLYRAYGCIVKIKGKQGIVKSFKIYIKEGDFGKFDKVRSSIVSQTHGELILNNRFDPTLWSEFVPKLLFDCSDHIKHQRPARNIGLQWHYLMSRAFSKGGVLQLEDVEIVYKEVVYNGSGDVMENPANILVNEAFPNKSFRVSAFKASGLRGFLKNCLPPFTSTSKFRRDQQILVIIGATGQHFYRLIVHNTGSCPSLMLASYEPETQKSTAALVGLKTVSDPLQFFNLQSSTAAVLEQRSTSSLPTVYDDVEGDSGQNKLMVGSMNGASKFTKGEGEEQQLGGTVYTKNLKSGMKMPAKIIEGRNNWLLMERDSAYEDEEMGENCERNFDHCNEMSSNNMPRDFLARLTRYFIREENESLSFFQKAQLEACEIMSCRRPHWGKRKAKSASLFLSIFFLIEKEVAESGDSISKELFVEIFLSRDAFIDVLMKALNRVDEVEATMSEGVPMELPNWTDDTPDVASEENGSLEAKNTSDEINQTVQDTLQVISGLSVVDKSKYVKVFTNNEPIIAIQHTKVKSLSKELGTKMPSFKAQKRNYPNFVTLKTETFTKMTASSSKGSSNTCPGFCTAVQIAKLSPETKTAITEVLGFASDDISMDDSNLDDVEGMEVDPLASQDYPEFTQSQSTETLKVCEMCSYKTRSKLEFTNHMQEHPKCIVCKKTFVDELTLNIHLEVHQTEQCVKCGVHIAKVSMKDHATSHEITDSYKNGLVAKTKGKKKKAATDPEAPDKPRLNSFHIYCRAFREAKKLEFPQLNMLGINSKLRDDWRNLSQTEKEAFKPNTGVSVSLPTSDPVSTPQAASTAHAASSSEPGQTTIEKCKDCGRLYFSKEALANHVREHHGVHNDVIVSDIDVPTDADPTDAITSDVIEDLSGAASPTDVAGEPAEQIDTEKPQKWYKVKTTWWPCKLIDCNLGPDVTVRIYDDQGTTLDVEPTKLKAFNILDRIPRSRTAEWRRAYGKALLDFEM